MSDSRQYTIGCYLSWCGAEVLYRFADGHQYELTRAFLNEIATMQFHDDELPLNRSAEMMDYYVIEDGARFDFQNFMTHAPGT